MERRFTQSTNGELRMFETIPEGWHIVGIGDFNGDGISDLLLRNADGLMAEWEGQSSGGFVDDANANILASNDWHVAGTGDFNGDGVSDILWRQTDGTVDEWLGQRDGSFENNGNASANPVDSGWQMAGFGDFNGDGRDDIVWRHTSGAVAEWQGQSDGSFINTSNVMPNAVDSSWQIVGIGDFNGDGHDDIFWRHTATGTIDEWLGQPDGGFNNNGGAAANVVGTDWSIAAVGDFNGDGHADILWRSTDGTITDWLGQANGGFVDNSAVASQFVSTALQVAGVGDFNGDGKSDMLLQMSDGTLVAWVGEANGALLSPVEKAWNDGLATALDFANNLGPVIARPAAGSGSIGLPMSSIIGEMFYSDGSDFGGSGGFVLMDSPTFDIITSDDSGLSADFDGNFGSMTLLDASTNTFQFDMNGVDLIGTYHAGPPPADLDTSPDAIVITAPHISGSTTTDTTDPTGYFLFDPNGSGLNFADGFGGAGSPTTGPAALHIKGGSVLDQNAAQSSLALLYKYSPTAHALIDAAAGITLDLFVANITGEGQQDGFYPNTDQLYWDPFEVVEGTNSDGSTYIESPIMLLAHELVHAAHASDPTWQDANSETTVIGVANQIAREMNAATGSNYDTSRDTEVRTQLYYTTAPTSTLYSIARPSGGGGG
jgi:hypothetical protein